MSIFASRTQQTITLPFDDERTLTGEPHTVTIQKLAGRQLEKAKEASLATSIEGLKRLGGPAFQQELGALGDPAQTAALVAAAQADPLNGYDRYVVLQRGIVAWTYEVPLTPAAIEDLSDEALEFLARAILALTLPARDGAAQKND
jgi:hypothetical protein